MPSHRNTLPAIRRMRRTARGASSGGRTSQSMNLFMSGSTSDRPQTFLQDLKLGLREVRDQRIAEGAVAPEQHRKALQFLALRARPGQPVGAKDQQRNGVESPFVDEHRRLAIDEVAHRTTRKWEF